MPAVPMRPDLEDLRPVSRGLAIIPRPPSGVRSSASSAGSRCSCRSATQSGSGFSVPSIPDDKLSAADIQALLSQRVPRKRDNLISAFKALDREGQLAITRGEFRRVVETFLHPLTHTQFEALLAQVPQRGNGTVAYMDFLGKYYRPLTAKSRCPPSPAQQCTTVADLQSRLRDKVGSNLKNVVRAFRLFDYNHDGTVQRHELQRVLESYCFPMSNKEFHRLWSHCTPNNAQSTSYKNFLEKLGVDHENHRKPSPASTELALNWNGVSQGKTGAWRRQETWIPASKDIPFQGLSLDEIQTVFLQKMCANYDNVHRALQAFDATNTGLVSQDDLKAVFSSFLFPMTDITFQGLLSRLGVKTTGLLSWRHFLARFWDTVEREGQSVSSRQNLVLEAPTRPVRATGLHTLKDCLLDAYPFLKKAFLIFDESRDGKVSWAEMRRIVEGLATPLTDVQFGQLMMQLDPKCTGFVNYWDFLDFVHSEKGSTQGDQKRQSPMQEMHQDAQEPAETTWPIVEKLLQEKLSAHFDTVMLRLQQFDHRQSGVVSQEELRTVLQQYGLTVSDSHFNRLCEYFTDSGGVKYRQFLGNLGVSGQRESSTASPSQSDRTESLNCSHTGGTMRQTTKDHVLKELGQKLAERNINMYDWLSATAGRNRGTLSVQQFRKMLHDCGVCLEEDRFIVLVEALGFRDGEQRYSEFLDKFKDSVTRHSDTVPQSSQSHAVSCKPVRFLTAEQCFSQMKERIKEFHGDLLTAFRLMDKNRDGVVARQDFRDLYESLMFVTKETEYQRLLDLMGLKPGATLNYSEFRSLLQSRGSTGPSPNPGTRATCILGEASEQVHSHLAWRACCGWPDMAKMLCHLDEEGQAVISKRDLRQLLYTYSMPISPSEFDQLWLRYDTAGRGFVTPSEFLKRLGVDLEEKGRVRVQLTPGEHTSLEPKDGFESGSVQTLHTGAVLQELRAVLRRGNGALRAALARVGEGKVEELLALLQEHRCRVGEAQLAHLLSRVGIGTDDGKLSYLDFMRALDGEETDAHGCIVEAGPATESAEGLSPEGAVSWLQELVTASYDTLHKAFCAFDKTRSGTVRPEELRQVLDHFCLRLTDRQFDHLVGKLAVCERDGAVGWKAFLQSLQLNKQETAEQWKEKVGKVTHPREAPPLAMSDIVTRIHEVVSARLYTITKKMADLDFARINVISKEDFRAICDCHFLRLTDEQFEDLWNRLPVNSFGNLEYRRFLKRFGGAPMEKPVTPESGITVGGLPTPDSTTTALSGLQRPKTASCYLGNTKLHVQSRRPSTGRERERATPLLNCEPLESRVCEQIHASWREIHRRCREADRERLGEISVEHFLAIMEELHIKMIRPEFEQLALKYDINSNGRFSYPAFLRHFVLMLKPENKYAFDRAKVQLSRKPMSGGVLSAQCAEALLRMQHPVQQHWRPMRHDFVSLDQNRSGYISLQDFRKVLRLYSINLSEEEFFHLCSFFDKNISGKISYNDFLRTFF